MVATLRRGVIVNKKMNKPISSYSLKIVGAFELPQEVEAQDYDIQMTGSVVSRKYKDNEDGTETLEYSFKPYTGEVLEAKGKTVKLHDKRRDSVKLRAMIEGVRQERFAHEDEEAFYERFHQSLRANFDEVVRTLNL